MDEMSEKLKAAYELLQNLQIQPTRSNMRILCYVEDVIQEAYKMMTDKNGGDENGTDRNVAAV